MTRTRRWRRAAAVLAAAALAAGGCTGPDRTPGPVPPSGPVDSWVYQLQGYPGGRLTELARAPHRLAVIDLARDGRDDYFTADEVAALRASGKVVLAYFEIGAIETYRPEYAGLRADAGDLILNRWPDWPEEFFVRYWDQRWWDRVVRPRIDQAADAGFDGIYLDTPLAYEELDLALVPDRTREDLARAMVDLIVRIGDHARSRRPGTLVFPQNSPELREYDGYLPAIDGVGMEELFFRAADEPCDAGFCATNLDHAAALRAAGKTVLAVDYAGRADNIRAACARYRQTGFAGYVTSRDLDRISAPCA
ncbi:endo alpha-1,4 polygalactosaminidase [Polymorphospora rubra]|uniref:Glycoside-hydrolase family GH114 TIM-barrel domain-containing protein n=1 Tax=Polymorphospora rubra TaxID=338584 RepID=A0A810N9D5_9ACTN|nr:endo alpha-1,4 polygalactosaminidase [Polymorphospora rubra]BCJ69857.1 hypothetical protein Prubr_68780 [Polymorphospora rubra]